MALWSFGTARVFTAESTGISMSRDARAARGASTEAVAVAVQGGGTGRHQTAAGQRMVRTGDADGRGHHPALRLLLDRPRVLHLDPGADRRARHAGGCGAAGGGQAGEQPLYAMVSRHLVELTRHADGLSASPMAAALGESTTQLVRALLAGADEDAPGPRRWSRRRWLTQVGPTSTSTCATPPCQRTRSQARWPCRGGSCSGCASRPGSASSSTSSSRRLEGAKADLATRRRPGTDDRAAASRWGFKDPTHFSRRFKAAYGMLPQGLAAAGGARGIACVTRPGETRPTRRCRRTSSAVRSRHCSCSGPATTDTDSHDRPMEESPCLVVHARGRGPPCWRSWSRWCWCWWRALPR